MSNAKETADCVRLWKEMQRRREEGVLATLVQVTGSHYRHAGARMLITANGAVAGTVSGGCLESDVRERALQVIRTEKAELIRYDTTTDSDLLLGTGMGCGGVVDLLLEPTSSKPVGLFMEHAARCVKERERIGVATVYRAHNATGLALGDRLFRAGDQNTEATFVNREFGRRISDDLRDVMASGCSHRQTYALEDGKVELFLECLSPPVSLLLLGAGDDAAPVVTLAKSIGWHVTIMDLRATFAGPERFAEADARVTSSVEGLREAVALDSFDAVVIMTHNYFRDRELLKAVLESKVRYIGLLGARKRAARLLDELKGDRVEFTSEHMSRLHAPTGLDLAAEGPHEIALSVVAEIQAALAGGTGQALRDMRA